MISYRCPDCGSDDECFKHTASDAPETMPCRGVKLSEPKTQRVERRVPQPDGTELIEYEEVELAPTMEVCGGTMLQRVSLPGEMWSRPARGFEPLVVFEAADPSSLPAGRSKYYIPGRNYEATEPGYKRIELTSMAEYNKWVKGANQYETDRMKDHRSMHEYYWGARRTAMRDHVNARIRHNPVLMSIARMVRARSDAKTAVRYGKPLDAHFHSQLLEFNQGNIQDYCDSETRWRSTRAR
jgi:hypothetical protein